ncbi:hypothetical protein H2200_000126 [Cladophialophora chaetospira]|uniref:Uncharacterized protein n=1 Tax=Cladophialophora chaetospira TaxID=386627 RepID=A0AA38XMU1_9EURO|nr:hypothetical protein H2200_000126 [Cladophialophora chaetospira]
MAPSGNDGNRPGGRIPAANPPVYRRGAYQYRPPLAAPTAPTDESVREQRRTAFRNQVRYPHALVDATINRHLNQHNWDVNRAVQSFWESEEAGQTAGVQHPPSVELGRLRALHNLQTGLGNNTNEALRTNNAIMAMLYNEKGWDLDKAVKEVTERNGLYDDIIDDLATLRPPVDGDVSRDERLARFIDITSTNSWYSAKQFLESCGWDLAVAIDAWFRSGGLPIVYPPMPRGASAVRETGLRDVNLNRPFRAVRGTLQQFDLELDAFDDQMTADTIIFNRPASEVNDDPEIEWSRVEELPEELRTPARTAAPLDPEPIPGRDYLPSIGDNRGGRGYPTAAIINRDRSAPALGCPDPTKLYVEYIRKGKYHCLWAEGNRDGVQFGWDDGADPLPSDLTEFDWHELSHIQKLTKWRNGLLLELTGVPVRDPVGDDLNKYENDWLREQVAIRFEEHFGELLERAERSQKGGEIDYSVLDKFGNGDAFPLPMSKAEVLELTRRFNETFAGKRFFEKVIVRCRPLDPNVEGAMTVTSEQRVQKDMSIVGDVPRPARTANIIAQQRFRYYPTAKQFLYGMKNAAKANKIDSTPDERDSDFEDAGAGDNDSGVAPSRSPPPAPAASRANDFGDYALHLLEYDGGVFPLENFQAVVDAEIDGIVRPRNMTSRQWTRVLGVMTEYYSTNQGRDEERVADRMLYHVGLQHLDLRRESMEDILGTLAIRRDNAPAAPAGANEEDQEDLEQYDSWNEDELDLEDEDEDEDFDI